MSDPSRRLSFGVLPETCPVVDAAENEFKLHLKMWADENRLICVDDVETLFREFRSVETTARDQLRKASFELCEMIIDRDNRIYDLEKELKYLEQLA